MWNFENKMVGGTHYSRIIASYLNVLTRKRKVFYPGEFRDWLEATRELSDVEINEIVEMATNGRFEAQASVAKWLDDNM